MWGARFHRLGPGLVGGAVGLLAWGSALDEARACVPEFGRVVSVTPSSDRHPANAAVVIGGYGLGTYGLTATIDDDPADLRIDESLSMPSPLDAGYDTLALRLSPEPKPGQRVVIGGDPSAAAWDATGTFSVEYVAEEGDLTLPPPSPLAWWWDLTTYEPLEDFDTDSCGFPPAAGSIAITARIADAPTVERPAFVRFRVSPETSTLGRSYQRVEFASSQEFTTWFLVYADQVRDPVEASQFCVELELLDAAGNGSGPEELCVPCRMKVRGQPPFERWCRPAEHACPSEAPPETPGGTCGETEGHDAGTGGEPEEPPDPGDPSAEPAPNEGPGDAGAGASPPGAVDGPSRDAAAESVPRDEPNPTDATADGEPPRSTPPIEDDDLPADDLPADTVPADTVPADAGDPGSSRMDADGKAKGPDEPRRRPLVDDDGGGCGVSSGRTERTPWVWALAPLLLVARRRRV